MLNTNYISPESIQRAKAISIEELLQSLGHRPSKQVGKELVYCSPLRNEQTPSFFVNPSKNCFTDFGGTEEMKGDIIRLAQLLWSVNFKEAVERLLNMIGISLPSFYFGGIPLQENTEKRIHITSVRTLQHQALIQYVNKRGISTKLANGILKKSIIRPTGRHISLWAF